MKPTFDNLYLVIGEIGIQKLVSSKKDLNRKLESSLKDLGLTKNDIVLISSNKLLNISNLFQQSSSKIYKKNNNLEFKPDDIFNNSKKEKFYLFSKNNRCEIYKQQFDKFYKSKIEDNSFIPSKILIGGGISYEAGGNDDIFLSENKIIANNLQTHKIISYIKDVYTNYKSISVKINSNIYFSNYLIVENLENIYKSLIILNNYYRNQIQDIRINHETLLMYLEEVKNRVLSIEKKINNYFIIKMNLNNKKEIELFDLLTSENKIRQIKEKLNNQLNYLKEKIEIKSKQFEEMIYNDLDNNDFNKKINNVIDEIKLKELKNKIISIELNFKELNKKYSRNRFEEEIKKIQENNNSIIVNNSNFTFSNLSNRNSFNNQNYEKDLFNNYREESEWNNLSNELNKIKNISNEILSEIKIFIEDSIIKKFFRFSSDIFITLDSFDSYNKKFKSYINLLENIDKDNYDLLFSLDEVLKFRFYYNEYERRICFLRDLKKTIFKLKKSIIKENEIRKKFNDELSQYFKEKLNENKLGIQNNIITFFDWDDVKGNFDVYGDKYYNNIEIEEDDVKMKIKNNKKDWKISLILSEGEIINKEDMDLDFYSQQEMISRLNSKLMEYKSKISNLEKDIEIKNDEFKELKFNIEQINNFLNSLYNNKIDKNLNISNKNSNDLKKDSNIFNPLYDEINKEDSLILNNNNNSNIIKYENNNVNENNSNEYLSIEQTYIIKKSIFSYFFNLLSIKNEEYNKLSSLYNSLQMSIEDQLSQVFSLTSIDKINLISIKDGTTNIFIGNSENIYPCLLLKEFINKKNTFLCDYYLDINCFSSNIKNILKEEHNIIIIGVVKKIIKDKENKCNEKKNEEYNNHDGRYKKLVILNKIKYLISYRKDLYSDELIFKNHIIYN